MSLEIILFSDTLLRPDLLADWTDMRPCNKVVDFGRVCVC